MPTRVRGDKVPRRRESARLSAVQAQGATRASKRSGVADRALSGVASGVTRRDVRCRVQRAIGCRGVCPPAAGSSATARIIATDA